MLPRSLTLVDFGISDGCFV